MSALADLAEARGSSLEELAEVPGVSRHTVQRVWDGGRPSAATAARLAAALAVKPTDVLDPTAWLARERRRRSPAQAAWLARAFSMPATGRPEWADEGPCRLADPEVFWPEVGEYPAEALVLCRRCPVLGDCRELFLSAPGPDAGGVWFGTTAAERREHRREQRRRAA